MEVKYSYRITNRTNPIVMMKEFEEGTEVAVVKKFDNFVEILNKSNMAQVCHISQLEKIK